MTLTYAGNLENLASIIDNKRYHFIQGDICDIDLQWIYECDYIINTAAESHVDNSIASSDEFLHSNILGVHNIMLL